MKDKFDRAVLIYSYAVSLGCLVAMLILSLRPMRFENKFIGFIICIYLLIYSSEIRGQFKFKETLEERLNEL